MRKRGIIIELTSLLDVILIMMFLVLTVAHGQVQATQETVDAQAAQVEALSSENEKLQTEVKELRSGLLSVDIMKENCAVVTVAMDEGRKVRVQYGDTVTRFAISWETETYARNAIRTALESAMKESDTQAVFIVLQYDRSRVYQSDYRLIENAIARYKNDPNVYTAVYDMKTE